MPCLFSCFSVSKHKKRRLFIKSTSSTDPRRGDHKAVLQAKQLENQEPVQTASDTTATSEVNLEEKRTECCSGNANLFEVLPVEVISDVLITQNGGKEDEKIGRVVHDENKGSQLAPEPSDPSQDGSRTRHSLKDLAFEGFGEMDGEKGRDIPIEESSESLFSLSIDSRKRAGGVEAGGEREVTSPMTKQGTVLELVLNPIQNVTDQKTVEVKQEMLQEDYDKENASVEIETRGREPILDVSSQKKLAVDTSLSSWLVGGSSSGATTDSAENSDSKSRDSTNGWKGRPVLGELNLQELKTDSVCVSRPNTRDPNSDDGVPLVGTIGSYLSCTEQTRNRMIAI